MRDSTKNVAIGSIVCVAIVLISWLLVSLHPTFGDGKHRVRVRFSNVDKIGKGTRVTFAGRPVGEVVCIELLPEARTKDARQGEIFAYEVTLQIDSQVA